MEHTVSTGVSVMPREAQARELPVLVARMALGAVVIPCHEGNKSVVGIRWDGATTAVSQRDFDTAKEIHSKIREFVEAMGKQSCLSSPANVLSIVEMASRLLHSESSGKKRIVMLSDNDGSGFWRMRLPARYMDAPGWEADITSAPVTMERALAYDVVFVQRFHSWDAFYVLESLKKAGKRIVYDIDDDLFSIPRDNPASMLIGRDQQMAARETMRLADVVTVSTEHLRSRLDASCGLKGKTVVIPNALDVSDGWPDVPFTGSQDEWKRIFWQGGPTHAEDWMQCVGAVEAVMAEDDRVRLTILGFMPPSVMEMVRRRSWQGRVEFMGFNEPETYYQMAKCVRADVGLAPLKPTYFSAAKSALKFLENTLIGMPTVASDTLPYSEVIRDGENGVLASGVEVWIEALKSLLNDRRRRNRMLMGARATVEANFDIRKVSAEWKKVLCQ